MKEQEMTRGNKIILGAAALLAVVIIGYAVFNNRSSVPSASGEFDNFAQCLANKGATMYGAAWCTHCQSQKAAFGDSFKFIKYVECPDNIQFCIDKGVQGYPTWLMGTTTIEEGFNGSTMQKLSDATSCPLPVIATSTTSQNP